MEAEPEGWSIARRLSPKAEQVQTPIQAVTHTITSISPHNTISTSLHNYNHHHTIQQSPTKYTNTHNTNTYTRPNTKQVFACRKRYSPRIISGTVPNLGRTPEVLTRERVRERKREEIRERIEEIEGRANERDGERKGVEKKEVMGGQPRGWWPADLAGDSR